MRLIDADTLIKSLFKLPSGNTFYAPEYIKVMVIDAAPTIDAEPVRHGYWEVIDAEEPRRYGCSECKRLSWHMENYCPNCGAKMEEDNESD